MPNVPGKLIALALAVTLLILPAGASAKEKRGAVLVATRLDGSQARGELIAVKPNSLLLLNSAGQDESVDRAVINNVRIVRKAHTALITLIGFATGAVAGGVWGAGDPEYRDEGGLYKGGALFGAAGALAGLGISIATGIDIHLQFAGEPEAVVAGYWERLRSYSREGRLRGTHVSSEKKRQPA